MIVMSLLKAILPVEYQTKIIFTLLKKKSLLFCVYVNVCVHVLRLERWLLEVGSFFPLGSRDQTQGC